MVFVWNCWKYSRKMTELESYAKGKFSNSELKAMLSLTKLAVDLDAGKMVDLDAAFKLYGNVLGESMKLLDEDMNDAMEGAGEEVDKAMQGAGNEFKKAYQDVMDEL